MLRGYQYFRAMILDLSLLELAAGVLPLIVAAALLLSYLFGP